MSGADFTIRDAAPDDAKIVMELQEQLFPDDPIALQENEFANQLNSKAQIFVATVNHNIVGFLVLRNRRLRPWTGGDFVGVLAGFRKLSLGRTMVEHAIKNSRRPIIRLFVRPSNTNAILLYKSLGFHKVSVRTKNYPDGEDAWVMMRFRNRNLKT